MSAFHCVWSQWFLTKKKKKEKKWITLLKWVSLGKCHIYHLNTSIWSKWKNVHTCTFLGFSSVGQTWHLENTTVELPLSFGTYLFFFKDFQQFFSLQVLFARSTRGLFLSFHSRPKILGVALTIITKTGIKHLVRTRHCPKALPTQSWAHVMPTQPCSAIIFFLHPLPTHSHTNTLLTLCSPDEMTEGAPGWAIFLKETRLIRPCSGKKTKKKTVLKNCRRTDVFIQNWCSH